MPVSEQQLSTIRGLYREFFGGTLEDTDVTPSEIMPLLFLGSCKDIRDVDKLKKFGITHVLSIGEAPKLEQPERFFTHKFIEARDLDDFEINNVFEEALPFLRDAIVDKKTGVVVHCAAGVSRSATVVTAFIMENQGWTAKHALEYVHSKRTCACPNMGFMGVLFQLENSLINKTYNYNIPK